MYSYSAKVSYLNIFQLTNSANHYTIYDSLGLTQSSLLKVRHLPLDSECLHQGVNYQNHLFQT